MKTGAREVFSLIMTREGKKAQKNVGKRTNKGREKQPAHKGGNPWKNRGIFVKNQT